MNMKTSLKPNSVKRVYVSIREQPKAEAAKLALQPKPPSQPGRFIRKRQDRCHTPEQVTSVKEKPSVSKFIYHRSLSPYVPPKENSFNTFCVPKDSSALLATPVVEKEEDLCLPYELAPGHLNEKKLDESEQVKDLVVKNFVNTGKFDLIEKIENFEDMKELVKICQSENLGFSFKNEANGGKFIGKDPARTSLETGTRAGSLDSARKTEKNFCKRPQVLGVNEAAGKLLDCGKKVEHCRTNSGLSENGEKKGKVLDKNLKIEGKRSKRASIRNLCKNLDLNKKVLTKAQLLVPGEARDRRESIYSSLANEENTTVASRTPSPNISQRNIRCQALSKNFKIKKEGLANEVEKQTRGKSSEKEGSEPWVSILKDLENGITLKDLPSFNQYQNSRVSVKLRRDCK